MNGAFQGGTVAGGRRFVSVCSGIEAASVAWGPLGWKAAALAEIAPFPRAVLKHHYPDTPLFGDFTKITDEEIRGLGPVQLLAGGTPCQSFSVAGLRAGMADPRGNLALAFLGLADRLRPRWVVWENVPGVLSSNGGRDFGAFLGALGQLGYGWAYRVLDAQHFGIPQRRRRVFVVGCLGDWASAAAVLFERHSLSGNPPPCREERARVAGAASPRAGSGSSGTVSLAVEAAAPLQEGAALDASAHLFRETGKGWWTEGLAGLRAEPGGMPENVVTMATGQGSAEVVFNASPALTCNHEAPIVTHTLRGEGFDASEDGTGRGTPLVPCLAPTPIDMRQASRGERMTNNRKPGSSGGAPGTGIGEAGDPAPSLSTSHVPAVAFSCKDYGGDAGAISPTLRAMGHAGSHANAGGQVAIALPFDTTQITSKLNRSNPRAGDTDHPLAAGAHAPAIALGVAPTLSGSGAGTARTGNARTEAEMLVRSGMAVRRLTPEECEDLQGFPRSHTRIPWRGKPAELCPDGPRYQALGNSWAVPVARWIGERIDAVDAILGISEADQKAA